VADAGSWVLGSWFPFWLHLSCNFYRNIVLRFCISLIILTFQMATLTDTSRPFTVPGNPRMHLNHQTSSAARSPKKPWQSRCLPSFRSSKSQTRRDPKTDRLSRDTSRQSTASQRRTPKWWKIRLFRGMIDDVKRRLPYYWSDWRDAWDYRVIPATVYMYFAKYDHTFFHVAPPGPLGPKECFGFFP
jgi:hypothetical protein